MKQVFEIQELQRDFFINAINEAGIKEYSIKKSETAYVFTFKADGKMMYDLGFCYARIQINNE